MAQTHSGLVAALRSLFVTIDTDEDFNTILPRCIEASELRIYRELLPVALLTTVQTTLVAGRSYFTVPPDFISPRSFVVYAPLGSNTRAELLRRDSRFMAEYWPDASATGTPKYWSEISYSTMQIAPTPSANFALELVYIGRPPPLSADNPTNWLTAFAPDMLEYACMAWLAGYGKNYGGGDDPRAPAYWEAQYARALASIQAEEAQRRGLADVPAGLKPST